eukprot:358823-Pelagomonas_calceolata.AAC.3
MAGGYGFTTDSNGFSDRQGVPPGESVTMDSNEFITDKMCPQVHGAMASVSWCSLRLTEAKQGLQSKHLLACRP